MTQIEQARNNMEKSKQKCLDAWNSQIKMLENSKTLPGTKSFIQKEKSIKRLKGMIKRLDLTYPTTNEEIIRYYGSK